MKTDIFELECLKIRPWDVHEPRESRQWELDVASVSSLASKEEIYRLRSAAERLLHYFLSLSIPSSKIGYAYNHVSGLICPKRHC
jgi:hypothetical protein